MKLNNNDDSHNSGLNLLIYNMLLDIESHPTWVCGLKHIYKNDLPDDVTSHPTWVCGLKPYYIFGYMSNRLSHPTWVCGLKQKQLQQEAKAYAKSHPTWVCGLKLERLYSA